MKIDDFYNKVNSISKFRINDRISSYIKYNVIAVRDPSPESYIVTGFNTMCNSDSSSKIYIIETSTSSEKSCYMISDLLNEIANLAISMVNSKYHIFVKVNNDVRYISDIVLDDNNKLLCIKVGKRKNVFNWRYEDGK